MEKMRTRLLGLREVNVGNARDDVVEAAAVMKLIALNRPNIVPACFSPTARGILTPLQLSQ